MQQSKLSVEHFLRFPEEMGTGDVFWPVGYLFSLRPGAVGRVRAQADMQRSLGLPVTTLSPSRTLAIVPEVNMDGVLGGTFCRRTASAIRTWSPGAAESKARELGAKFLFERPRPGCSRTAT